MNGKILIAAMTISLAFFLISCEGWRTTEAGKKLEGDYPITINKVQPEKYQVGDTIDIIGENFGESRGSKFIVFKGDNVWEEGYAELADEQYLNWSDEKITMVVPEGASSGKILVQNKLSNSYTFDIQESWFVFIIDLFVKISLGITVIFIYLKINKIWKRKHEKEVAESQSLAGLSIYVLNCILWVIYYIFVEDDLNSTIDTAIYIFEGSIFFLIGTGIFVRGQKAQGIWALIKNALKIERKEADYLLKKWFKPQNAEIILNILHQIAMIDEDFDPKEQDIIKTFAKEWNISYDIDKFQKLREKNKSGNYMTLRKSVEDYLDSEPPDEQVAQLKDMITTMIEADEKVTEEEALISSEIIPMVENYLKKEKERRSFKVLIVPQNLEHESAVKELIPNAERIKTSGGVAYAIGDYYSHKYAEMICDEYRDLKLFTIVHTPPGVEIR